MMCKKNCQGYENFSILLLHNSAFLMGVIYELEDLAGGLGWGGLRGRVGRTGRRVASFGGSGIPEARPQITRSKTLEWDQAGEPDFKSGKRLSPKALEATAS